MFQAKRPRHVVYVVASLMALALLTPRSAAAVEPESGNPGATTDAVTGPQAGQSDGVAKGGFSEQVGLEFSILSVEPYPATTGQQFTSSNLPGQTPDIAEVGGCCGGASDQEVRGFAEFPSTLGQGGSGATLSFTVDRLGGLFNQPPGGDFDIVIEAYSADVLESLSDFSVPSIGRVGSFRSGGLEFDQRLEFDVSAMLGLAVDLDTDLGIRLRAGSSPGANAIGFRDFRISKRTQRAAFGGLGAEFCPTGLLGRKGACTDPLGSGDRFGTSIKVSGNTVIIGVPGDDDAGPDSGAVFVFEKNRNGSLVFQQKLVIPPEYLTAGFGESIAIDGGVLVVGAPREPTTFRKGVANLRAAVFSRTLGQAFDFKQPIVSAANTPNSGFGASIALRGNNMVVGAPERGQAVVFEFEDGFPREVAVLDPPGGKGALPNFGRAVAVSNGKFAITGGSPLVAGSLGLYQTVAGNLTNLSSMSSNDSSENFGASVTMDGDNVFVGAPAANLTPGGSDNRTGAVFSFDPSGAQRARFTPPDAVPNGQFGTSIAASGGRLAVGQPGPEPGGKGSGSSRVVLFEAVGTRLIQVDSVEQQGGDEAGIGTFVAFDGDDLLAASPTNGTVSGILDTREIFVDRFETTSSSTVDDFTFPLAVGIEGTGEGTVVSDPVGIDCPSSCGSRFPAAVTVSLTPDPAPGSLFTGWGGDCDGTGACDVTMLRAQSVLAFFDRPADLQAVQFTRPEANDGAAVIGQSYFLAPIVSNAGFGPAGPSRVAIYVSLDGDADVSDDFRAGSVQVGSLGPGESESARLDFTMPDLAGGAGYAFFPLFVVDELDEVSETNEENVFRSGRTFPANPAGGKAASPREVPSPGVVTEGSRGAR